jgi:hypothetical protein
VHLDASQRAIAPLVQRDRDDAFEAKPYERLPIEMRRVQTPSD